MCGRYQLLRPQDIAARFETVNTLADLHADEDVRPTEAIPVVNMRRELTRMHWGFSAVLGEGTIQGRATDQCTSGRH